ncbi:putative GTPase-activator protein for Rho-like GTPases [Lyophyllum shimeji]|uniref:GTPase-activator protein for Rho-like GTPases n=1 Tax=Lyophyllum shimeji TaxID=47721 RepID=A0A9P3UTC5_LYOSH|nr:putative GTPase-activator protein for Rho-like GTPases [Lyophyllum shimeji]
MSHNAANGSSSIYGTPSRNERLPFPQSSNPSPLHTPQRPPAQSSTPSSASHSASFSTAPTSSSSVPPVTKDRPVTSASLLKAHAAAEDPKLAALEQAVNDRNTLSSQNAQLWKLIEKQRAGYNQILKELERVRGERDAYKAKLNGSGGGGSGREDPRHRGSDADRNAKRSFSENVSGIPEQNGSSAGAPRQAMSRHYSDDQPTPRSANHPQLHYSRSHEPLSPRDRILQGNAGHSTSSSSLAPLAETFLPPPPASAPSTMDVQSANSVPKTRSAKPSPMPLVVPPRSESLTVPASALTGTQETNPSGHPRQQVPTFPPQDPLPGVSGDLASQPSTRPVDNYPRKSSLADSVSSGMSTGTTTSSDISSSTSNVNYGPSQSSAASPYTPPSQQYHHTTGLTPQTTPAGYGGAPSDSHPHTPKTPVVQSQPYPQILTTPSTPSNSAPTAPTSTANGMLSTAPEARPQMLSRDSRISLPDEARQYIANMTDSPIPSPRLDAFAAKASGPSRATPPQVHIPENPGGLAPPSAARLGEADSPGGSSEFLDMNDDEDDEDETDDEQSAAPDAEDVADNASLQDTPRRPTQATPPVGAPQLQDHDRKTKPRVEVDQFPLPPPDAPTMTQAQMYAAQGSHEAMYQQQLGSNTSSAFTSTEQISPLENPYSPPGQSQSQQQPLRLDEKQAQQPLVQSVPANFRALPLLPTDLPHTTITVSHSFVRPNDRGKEVLSFIVFVDPGNGKEGWKVEKMYSDVLGLDQRVRAAVGKGVGKKIASLPEGKLWKDHAPAKVDQRKAVLESYLQMLINLPVKENNEVIAFFTSDIVRETKQPVMQVGHKEGYLTKRGKNFGGWKTRYFVLQGPVLEYYDCRGGAHLGSILITGAQIGRQQRSERTSTTDEEKEYRHAFLIVEAKKGPGGNHPRHVLCAESDEDRDAWVEILVRYFTGTYSEEPVRFGPAPSTAHQNGASAAGQPRTSTSSNAESPTTRRPTRGFSKDDISISRGAAVPISQLPPDQTNAKLFPPSALGSEDYARSSSPSKHAESSPIDTQNAAARRLMERGQGHPSSLPDSSPLSSVSNFNSDSSVGAGQRANSELGHYPDLTGRSHRQVSPERRRARDHDKHKSFHPTLNPVSSSPTIASPVDRLPSPDKLEANGKPKISGPRNGAPIPHGFKFGSKDAPTPSESAAADRRIKSRSFWGFGRPGGGSAQPAATYVPRAVFGVTLEDSLEVAQIANLPAIVFRSIQYLEAKKAEQEEGIYRLSGSSAVIKSLKDRFNAEGDVDLLASDEYWDPHAIAGLLKSFLRELPASILTRDLHLRFLAVIDFVDPQERIRELSYLIASLPLANYSLLRALTAHLILIVQNSSVNKMTMRNVGIVFSPTLGIPAGVFSLMLGEFNRVFNVDGTEETASRTENGDGEGAELDRRNSKHYSDAAADQLLGLTGRTLKAAATEAPSDGDDLSVHEESGTETTDGDFTVESSSESGQASTLAHGDGAVRITAPDTPVVSKSKTSKASTAAATKGLNLNVSGSERGNRHSRIIGLPTSPRPTQTSTPSHPPPSPALTQRD